MADSDGEYVDNASDEDYNDHHVTRERGEDRQGNGPSGSRHQGRHGHGGSAKKGGGGGGERRRRDQREAKQAAWETVKRSWDTVGEAEDGQVVGVEFLEAAEKRRRVLRDTTPLQRGIIRHMVLVLDMSFAMSSRDYLPTCHRVALATASEFVAAYFEQNPISQLAILAMRDGVALRISDMSGDPAEHLDRLRSWEMGAAMTVASAGAVAAAAAAAGGGAAAGGANGTSMEPSGHPSLQNALEMARGALFHTPAHGTREVLIIFGALLSSDPGDIHDTIAALVADRVRVSIVGLAAKVAICSEICSRTNPGNETAYAVARHDVHFRELVLAATTPPATVGAAAGAAGAAGTTGASDSDASLLMMGFPSRAITDAGVGGGGGLSVCACHNRPIREGYACTRCGAKVCRLPAECPACGLTLILSTHLARSYHHLFPLRNWTAVSWTAAVEAVRTRRASTACHACLAPFPDLPPPEKLAEVQAATAAAAAAATAALMGTTAKTTTSTESSAQTGSSSAGLRTVSESGRYACEVCGHHFCIDCDVFAHEVIHNCPGCQSDTRPPDQRPAPPPPAAAAVAVAAAAPTQKAKAPVRVKVVQKQANGNSGANGEMIMD